MRYKNENMTRAIFVIIHKMCNLQMKKAGRKFLAFSFSIYFYTRNHTLLHNLSRFIHDVFRVAPKCPHNTVLEKFHCQIAINLRRHTRHPNCQIATVSSISVAIILIVFYLSKKRTDPHLVR